MKFEISQQFFFDAAHTLHREMDAEGSARIHGHTYNAEVAVAGPVTPETGMVVDLGHLRSLLEKIRDRLDHRMLDDVAELGHPTLENLCLFVAREVAISGLNLTRVSIWRNGIGDRCDLRFE
ncbi:6-carboxy-5,6,7,8-tetrahydropterin synthase [Paraburkholderia unamae]|uniref:6-carboxytetrahydropterin synthase n=1 Tax=Paraburkholderia unamae TaxID=219649 RepID=UPI001CAF8E68|nr:6-carboxytetrahydropterin synthase [Paraburkholderia unamae]CAG9261447.1 6-carboxy-5,6,7,8-tetrahydropterin synthase [Paraburkholderia unamae]